MRKAMVLGVLGLAGTLASPAFADDFTGFRLTADMSSDTLASDLFFEPLLETEHLSNKRFGYGFGGGWALNRYFAVEVGLKGGSEFNDKPFQAFLPGPEYFISSHTDVKGIDATLVGSVWIGNKFSVFGRVGMFGWKAEQTVSVGNYETATLAPSKASVSVDDTGFDPVFGIGIQTQLDGALVRVEYKQTEIGNLGTPGAFNLRDSTLNSLDFSIVWVLH